MIKFEHIDIHGWEAAIRGMRNPMNSWEKSDSTFFEWDDTANYQCTIKDISNNHKTVFINELDPALEDWDVAIGDNDWILMKKLAKAGSEHSKYRRFITVTMDITAPLYWWKEFDTYKVGTVANSCSTMHKIHAKEFTMNDFSHEHLIDWPDIEMPDSFDSDHPDNIGDAPIIYYATDTKPNYYFSPKGSLKSTIKMLNRVRERYLETKDKNFWWQMIQLLPSSYNQRRTVMFNYENLARIYQQRKDHKLDEWREFCAWVKTLPYSKIITLEEEHE